ncbi:class I SAM-dependent methyltransferase [Streptomyces smyrnaeus]|uniref:class I SAM-dependent methyltransferase n=2 Tax=Streptomyces smyrnaeus TaxID=1387713 RepID=UPI003798F3FF
MHRSPTRYCLLEGNVLGVDLSAPMLERARRDAAAEGLDNITFGQGDAQVHPFPTAGSWARTAPTLAQPPHSRRSCPFERATHRSRARIGSVADRLSYLRGNRLDVPAPAGSVISPRRRTRTRRKVSHVESRIYRHAHCGRGVAAQNRRGRSRAHRPDVCRPERLEARLAGGRTRPY